MTERFRNPVIKYTTDTLKTLPGSKLYFYQNGTSTPKVVYADKNKVTSLGAEVTSDSAGVFVPIFLDGTYRVTLKNAAGTTQTGWPVDNVGGEDTTGAFDDYSAITSYSTGEIVTGSNGLIYQSQADSNLNNDPTISANRPTWWLELKLSATYNAASTYASGEWVIYSGNWYKAKASATGQTPSTNSAYWDAEYVVFQWNSTTTFASGASAFVGVTEYISQQGTNLNHNPVGDSGTWWLPFWQTIPPIAGVKYLSGGGALTARFNNSLTDAGAYTFPLANSVPANTALILSISDTYSAFQPTATASGSDLILRKTGTYNTFQFRSSAKRSYTFISNGTDRWVI